MTTMIEISYIQNISCTQDSIIDLNCIDNQNRQNNHIFKNKSWSNTSIIDLKAKKHQKNLQKKSITTDARTFYQLHPSINLRSHQINMKNKQKQIYALIISSLIELQQKKNRDIRIHYQLCRLIHNNNKKSNTFTYLLSAFPLDLPPFMIKKNCNKTTKTG